jgi:hypothetical protein
MKQTMSFDPSFVKGSELEIFQSERSSLFIFRAGLILTANFIGGIFWHFSEHPLQKKVAPLGLCDCERVPLHGRLLLADLSFHYFLKINYRYNIFCLMKTSTNVV